MRNLAFDLISPQKKSKIDLSISEKFYFFGLIGALLFALTTNLSKKYFDIEILNFEFSSYIIIGLFLAILISTWYRIFDYNGNNLQIKGFITFDENQITINNATTFPLTELKNLTFDISDYKGRLINIQLTGFPTKSFGGENFVEFEHGKQKYKYQFVIKSAEHGKTLLDKALPKMRNRTEIKY